MVGSRVVEPDSEGIAGIPRRLFAARSLLRARKGRPVTQGEIAAAVGVTEGQIGHWEKGRQTPDVVMLDKLATALEVTPWWLTYGLAAPPQRFGPSVIQENDAAVFEEPNVPESKPAKKKGA